MSHIAGTICIHSEQSGFCDCFIVITLILFVNRQTPCSFRFFFVTIQDCGRSGRKIRVKLACTRVFLPVLTSEESPMLLVRLCRTRRCPVLNNYFSSPLSGIQPFAARRYSIVPFIRTIFSFSVLSLPPYVQRRPHYSIRILQGSSRHSGCPGCPSFLGRAMYQRHPGKRSYFFQRMHPPLLLLPELQNQQSAPGQIHFF